MPNPGEVFYLPPDLGERADKGDHPHVLLSLCGPDTETVTFAYGSTRRNDAAFGAEHVLIDPFATTYRGTGFIRPTYVYPSRLVGWPADELGQCTGRIIDELPEIRASLARALGLGAGVTRERNRVGSSRRGRVVELSPALAAEWDVSHAVVITEPNYSRYGYQQTVVPLLDHRFEAALLDVEARGTMWLNELRERYRTVKLAVAMVATAYQPTDITLYLDTVVPADLMAEVDDSLAAHFGLERHV